MRDSIVMSFLDCLANCLKKILIVYVLFEFSHQNTLLKNHFQLKDSRVFRRFIMLELHDLVWVLIQIRYPIVIDTSCTVHTRCTVKYDSVTKASTTLSVNEVTSKGMT